MAYEFKFPDIGEGITEGELLAWKVNEGDIVAEDQTLAEMETDKAVVELPSPRAGRVSRLHAAEGDIIQVGDVLVTIDEGAAAAAAAVVAPAAPAAPASAAGAGGAALPAPAPADRPSHRRPAGAARSPRSPSPQEPEPYTGSVVGVLEEAPEEEEEAAPARPRQPAAPAAGRSRSWRCLPSGRSPRSWEWTSPPSAGPARAAGSSSRTSRMWRKPWPTESPLRERLGQAPQLRRRGTAAAAAIPPSAPAPVAPVPPAVQVAATPAAAPLPGEPVRTEPAPGEAPVLVPVLGGAIEADAYGPVERVPFRGVRRTMARHMAESVAKQAQVTTMDEADVTIIKRIREKERTVAAERGVRLTYLAFVVKACTASLKRFPRLNAVLEESGEEFVLKRYYNIGIAIDTKYGLVVPNIKDADQKSIFRIAEEIVDLVDRADERRLELSEFHGGTFTISNYGAVGTTFATPVINYPEVAILGMGRVRELPVVREGKVVTRLMLPLSLTFDHQLIDGAEAARFLNLVIGYWRIPIFCSWKELGGAGRLRGDCARPPVVAGWSC